MFSTSILSAFAAAAMLFTATAAEDSKSSSSKDVLIPTPTVTLPANPMTDVGCFQTPTPLENHGPWKFQTRGNCQFICIMLDKPVMALSDGTDCWCGDLKPPETSQTNNGSCDTTCPGFPDEMCGGPSLWWVTLTGTTRNRIDFYEPESSSSSSSAAPTSTRTSVSAPSKTAVASPSETPEEEKKGPNKAGIAAGVVVGVVALAAIIGGAIFFLRQRKRREIEEEHRRREQVNSFMAGGKLHTSNSSMTDSRLDPEFMNRRQSNGSIADNEDYSRRILKVTNA